MAGRLHSRIGSWLALFALAVQLVLSFGHVHVEGVATAAPALAAQLPGDDGGSAPAGDDHGKAGDDFCAICAVLALAASSALPTAPALIVPPAWPLDWLPDVRSTHVSFGLYGLFQARAPPRFS